MGAGRRRLSALLADACWIVLLLGIGGSLFEHLAVDSVWPENARVIQPEAGGIQRKFFWIPYHMSITLLLAGALWASWPLRRPRTWMMAAAGLYLALRIWSFLYFIPAALKFEESPAAAWDPGEALQWVRLSVLRLPLMIGAAYAAWRARRNLALRPPEPDPDVARASPASDLQRVA
jgi:hypothetical protein